MCTWGVWWHVSSRVGTLFFISLFAFMIYFEVLSNVDMWVEVTCELTFKCLVPISCHTIVLWLELSSKKAWHAWCHYFIRPFLVYEWICGFGRGLTLALHPSWMRHGWWHYTGICNWPNTKFNYSNRHKRWKRWESPIVWVQRFLCTIAIMGSNSPQDPRCELDWGNMQMPSYGFLLQLPLLVPVWAIWQRKLDL